jgi:hypothetical protein
VNAQGHAVKVVFQHIYDGLPHPTPGSPDWDSVAYTRTGNTINFNRFKNGRTVQIGELLIAPGKTFTLIVGGVAADNQPFYTVAVFDKE